MSPLSSYTYFNRDLSWLSFNHRVLQEAANPAVPLYERIRFLAIFSSNLEEFFRVRISALMALGELDTVDNEVTDPHLLLEVQATVQQCQEEFGRLLTSQLLPQLVENGVHLYYGEPLLPAHESAVTDYFFSRVLAFIQPVWLTQDHRETVQLPDSSLYFVVAL